MDGKKAKQQQHNKNTNLVAWGIFYAQIVFWTSVLQSCRIPIKEKKNNAPFIV